MISGADARALLETLPDTSFIRRYCWYAAHCTDAPIAYHVGVALSLLGAVSGRDCRLATGNVTFSPQWILIVGDSGDSRKTSAIRKAQELLTEAQLKSRIGGIPGSAQALAESLQSNPTQLVSYGEFGDFLSSSNPGGVLATLREAYTSVWDCVDVTIKLIKGDRDIPAPRLSMLAGVTPTYLEAHTKHVDWEGGFLSRFAVIHAQREHTYVLAPGLPNFMPVLVDQLCQIANRAVVPAYDMDFDAKQRFEKWYLSTAAKAQSNAEPWAKGLAHRAPTVAVKAALAFSADYRGDEVCVPWRIDDLAISFGIAFADWHLRSAESVLSCVQSSRAGRDQRAIMLCMSSEPRNLGEILVRVRPSMNKREALVIIDTLLEMRRIYTHYGVGGEALYSTEPQISQTQSFDLGNVYRFTGG
jgi:hypothetical protein